MSFSFNPFTAQFDYYKKENISDVLTNGNLVSTSIELQFRDTSTRIYSNATQELTIEALTKLTLGVAGDIELGDGTLRKLFPNTNLKEDLGDATHRFNDAWIDDIFIGAGDSSSNASVGGSLTVNTTTVGNIGAGEDDLMTYTLPANVLSANGYQLEIIAWGTFAGTINTKRLRAYFGSTLLLDTAGLAFNGADWSFYSNVVRTGASSQKAHAILDTSSTLLAATSDTTAPAESLSSTVVIKITGEATADNDVTQQGLIIRYFPL